MVQIILKMAACSLFLVSALIPAIAGGAEPSDRVVLSAFSGGLTVESRYLYVTDPGGELNIRDVSGDKNPGWILGEGYPLFLGVTDDVVWIRMAVRAGPDSPSNWVLTIDWPFFDILDMYLHDPVSDHWDTGVASHKDLPYAFPFLCPAGEGRTIYLRLHASSIALIPLKLWDAAAFRDMGRYRLLLLGMFFGILGVMCCYNLSLFLFTKDDGYAYYCVYVVSIILYALGMTGVGPAYLWGESLWIKTHSYGLFSSFSFLMATLFIRRFLSLKKVGGWLLHLSTVAAVFWIWMTFLYALSNARWLVRIEDVGAVASCFIGLATAIILWNRGSISAKYLTIAWTLLIIATFVLMMGLTGVIPYTPIVQYSQNLGFIVEVVLLSIALAERINRERAEKEAAQEMSVELHRQASESRKRELLAQAKVLEMERATKDELKRTVEVRTRELRETLTALEAANEVLDHLSRTDSLTQVANRRHFDAVLKTEFRRSSRQDLPLSVLLGDIDHFKAINDTHGHPAGDECLQMVASVWKARMARAGDLVARYGGEEFAAILPATGAADAVTIAERIRRAVGQISHTHNGEQIRFTISIGVAVLAREGADDIANLLERADDALYRAKEKGRNKVVLFELEAG